MKRWIIFSIFSILMGLHTAAWSVSVVNLYSQNGLGTDLIIQAGYGDPGFPFSSTFDVDGDLSVAGLVSGGPDRSGTSLVYNVAADNGAPPAGSGVANGTASISFNYGNVGTNDSFSIAFSGTASALTANTGTGTDLDAFVSMASLIQFSIDPIAYGGGPAPVPGQLMGSFTLNQLAPLGAYEVAKILWWDTDVFTGGPTTTTNITASLLAGDLTLDLQASHLYQLLVSFDVLVPYGIDPPFDLGLTGGITVVPEPSSYLLMGIGLLLLFGFQRKHLKQ